MKNIILCADDYGQNTAISQAIIQLLKEKRLSATSCMTTTREWEAQAKWLHPFQDKVDLGLHFNLTEGKPLSSLFSGTFPTLLTLLIKAYWQQLDQAAIEAECHAQIDQFQGKIGRLPDFIDGHQHIHQLPTIREALFAVYKKRLQHNRCYIRCVSQALGQGAYFKRLIIQACGANLFKKQLIQRAIPHNTSFAGFYSFKQAKHYARIFSQFLQGIQENGLMMCHPGLPQASTERTTDPIAFSRPYEYHYFLSEQFFNLCEEQRVKLVRFQ